MKIENFEIGKDGVFIIAELSANHNGSLDTALETVRAAKRAGANCIKLQTYTADTITLNSNKDDFLIKNTGNEWEGKSLYELFQGAYTPWEWHSEIIQLAKKEGLICFSSPFDFTAVDFLEKLNVPAYKIASFEITDVPLIEYIASKGKPLIISTGIATKEDIELALDACKRMGNNQIALLKCTSSYPAPIDEANLIMIKDLQEQYNVFSGLSDHTLGITAPIVATSLGAQIIEKHFILDQSVGGPDAFFSLNEKEFTKMVKAVRDTEKSIGEIDYSLNEKQKKSKHFSRSLFISKDVKLGETISKENIKSVRPGTGLHPKYYHEVLGKKFNNNFEFGEPLSFDKIE